MEDTREVSLLEMVTEAKKILERIQDLERQKLANEYLLLSLKELIKEKEQAMDSGKVVRII